jgi:hypothetical protein
MSGVEMHAASHQSSAALEEGASSTHSALIQQPPDVQHGGGPAVPATPATPAEVLASSELVACQEASHDSSFETGEKMRIDQRKFFDSLRKQSWDPKAGRMYDAFASLFSSNLTPDTLHPSDKFYFKFLKFLAVSFLSLYIARQYATHFGFGHDASMTLSVFMHNYFFTHLCDATLFYVVSRLSYRRGVDCMNYAIPMFLGGCIWNDIGSIPSLSHAITKDSITDSWEPITFVVFIGFTVLLFAILLLHFKYMRRANILLSRLFEVVATMSLTVLPLCFSESFHLHHWLWAWLVGMHFNLYRPWSFAMNGFMWGLYLNGIALYGRDPLLGCAEVMYAVKSEGCELR